MERKELAEKAGVSYSTLSKMEARDYMPSTRKLKAVAAALKVGPQELIKTRPGQGPSLGG